MIIQTTPQLLSRLHRHRMLRPLQHLELVEEICPHVTGVGGVLAVLVDRGWLTPFQSAQVRDTSRVVSVGPYLLVDRLGGGGGSHVYLARDTRTGQEAALKVLHETAMEQEETLLRFRREILVAMALDHPNVVRAVDGYLGDDFGYLAMEYQPGVDLMQLLIKVPRLEIGAACDYARQAALGLGHIHQSGLIHRDIKPGNLLVTRAEPGVKIDPVEAARSSEGHVLKILDLGLVRTHHFASGAGGMSITGTDSLLGTPDYMAPEQARNPRLVDIRADVYALGCTLFQLLTGKVPFPGGSMMQKLIWHQMAPIPAADVSRPEVPDALSRLVRRMMAKPIAERPATPDEVADALLPFC